MDDLPPDMVREISGRLHHAVDFVRFHAVCTPWRDTRSGEVPCRFLLPWLLSLNKEDNKDSIKIRCAFSKTSYRAPPPAHRRSWLANADGTGGPCCGLHDPLSGAHTVPLPPFPDRRIGPWEQKEDPDGIVYGDGTILLFRDSSNNRFRAALLRPGDTAWTLVDRNLPSGYRELCIVYHGGKIMFTVNPSEWHVVMAANDGVAEEEEDDVLVRTTWSPREDGALFCHRSFALESRGELLWVSLRIPHLRDNLRPSAASVSVLALQEATEEEGRRSSWVRKDGRSLADVVLFLGWPNSFAMEASGGLGGDGGCAYFFFYDDDDDDGGLRLGVFRYNLIDGNVELVDWIPRGLHHESYTWVVPHHAIAPSQALKQKQRTTGRRIIQVLRAFLQCVTAKIATFVRR